MFIVAAILRDTANKLAKRCNCQCYDYRSLPEKRDDFVVNYGGQYPDANLNPFIFKNKITQYELLKDLGRSPQIWLNIHDIPENEYPILARRKFSSDSQNIFYLEKKKDIEKIDFEPQFYVKYINKKSEYRVHILGNKAFVTKKIKVNKNDKDITWANTEGFYQPVYNGKSKYKLLKIGELAISAIGYDFGAIDILLGKDNKFYILEINSAPCLLKWMRKLYTQYFQEEYNKWLENKI